MVTDQADMPEEPAVKLVCNQCGDIFHLDDCCPQCHGQAHKNNGIYRFDNSEFYYGDPPREVIRSTLADIPMGVSPLVVLDYNDHAKEPRRQLGKYLGDPRRIAPLIYLDKEFLQQARILDYGCGLGAFSWTLSAYCQEVFALDATLERVAFTHATSTYLHRTNVTTVKGSLSSPVFFADHQFDLVILNGVLEWIPETLDSNAPPRRAQLAFLKRVKNLLKPGGIIYLGIENRYAYDYFVGRVDHHSGLLFGSLLPRCIANVYSRCKNKKPYRTYTYSHLGYKKLFAEAGLTVGLDTALYPSYQFPKHIGGMDQYTQVFRDEIASIQSRGRKNRLLHTMSRIPFSDVVIRRTPPAFGFFLSDLESMTRMAFKAGQYYLSQDGYLQDTSGPKRRYRKLASAIWKMPESAFAVQQEIRDKLVQRGRLDLAAMIPSITKVGDSWEENTLIGRPLVQDLLTFRRAGPPGPFERLYRDAMRKMSELYGLVASPRKVGYLEIVRKWHEAHVRPYYFNASASLLDEIVTLLQESSADMALTPSPIHGNLTPRNILVHEDCVTAIIDWAMAEPDGLYEVDLLDGLYCYVRLVQGWAPTAPGFYGRFRMLHVGFSETICVAPPSPAHPLYLFVAIRNAIMRGRGCFLDVDELRALLCAWKGYLKLTDTSTIEPCDPEPLIAGITGSEQRI